MSESESNSETENGGAVRVAAEAGGRGGGPWNEEFGDPQRNRLQNPKHADHGQGAADPKAQAPLPPAPQNELEAWILVSGTRLDEFGCLLLVIGWSWSLIFGLWEGLGTSF